MRRVYAVAISLALLLVATPAVASAEPYAGPAARQQAINEVIARGLSQRGVPFTYGGGDVSGPTASTVPAPSAASAIGPQLANVPAATLPAATLPAPALPAPALPAATSAAMAVPTAGVVGFDASGLIQYAFAGVGIKMPRSSGEQYKVGRKVMPSQALPGDLMFFGPEGTQSVAMFIGNGQMLEATEPGVTVSPVRTNGMTPYLTRMIEW